MMDLKSILQNLHKGSADWVAIRSESIRSHESYVRDGQPESNHIDLNQGLMIEVLCDGQFAWASSSRSDFASIEKAYKKACQLAKAAAPYAIHSFSKEQRPAACGQYSTPGEDHHLSQLSDINDTLIDLSNRLKEDKRIIRSIASFKHALISSQYVCSNGSDIQQDFSITLSNLVASAEDQGIVQTRSHDGEYAMSYQGGIEKLHQYQDFSVVDSIREEVLELLYAEECPTEQCSLLLMPDQMTLQIHESIGHPLEIDRMLGDERNYAGSSFVKLEDIGNLAYGSPILNVYFDPTIPHQLASYQFDDQGRKAQKTAIIKNGKLVNALGGLDSQVRSGVEGVANARAESWYRPPIDRMANLNIEAGEGSEKDMIAAIERGVLMKANRSWSIDDYRKKFQFGCEIAYLIEDGEIKKTLRNPNYRGVTTTFWHKLRKLGGPETFAVYGTPNCGKGEPNQVANVGHASPMALFDDVEVFGGVA